MGLIRSECRSLDLQEAWLEALAVQLEDFQLRQIISERQNQQRATLGLILGQEVITIT